MSSCPSSDSTPHLDSVPLLVSSTRSRTVILCNWFGSNSHVLWFLFLQVTLCMQTRGSWKSTCHSLCTTSTTELLMSAPSRSFAGQCLCDSRVSESLCALVQSCGNLLRFDMKCNKALFCVCSVLFRWDCINVICLLSVLCTLEVYGSVCAKIIKQTYFQTKLRIWEIKLTESAKFCLRNKGPSRSRFVTITITVYC